MQEETEMSDETKTNITQQEALDALNAVREATKEIKQLKEQNKGGISELQTKLEKANALLDKHEEQNQVLVAEKQAEKKALEEAQERIKDLEAKTARLSTANYKDSKESLNAEIKSLELFTHYGSSAGEKVSELDRKYLRSDSDTEGGFLMTESYDEMMIKPITEISPIRQVARVKKIDTATLNIAARETLVTSYWTGEGETPWTKSNSTYRSPKIPTHSLTTSTDITTKELNANWFDMESEIMGDMVESRAQIEGNAFVSGDGTGKPKGLYNGGIDETNSGSASTFDYKDLITITGELKTGYNSIYGFNRKTLAFIRQLEDGGGRPIWIPGNTAAGIDSQLNGYSYIEIPDMDDVGTNAKPVIFADFNKLYTIVDSFQANMLRNPYIKQGFVVFSLESWVGGQVVLAEAGQLLKCAT